MHFKVHGQAEVVWLYANAACRSIADNVRRAVFKLGVRARRLQRLRLALVHLVSPTP
jgi:hypothetical protein